MKKIIVCLLLSAVVYGQQDPHRTLSSGAPGTVTLPLAEYDLLVERAAHKPKPPEIAPLPFVLSRGAFKLNLVDETVAGTLDLEGEVLRKGPTKVPLATGLTILEAKQTDKALPLMLEGPTHTAVLAGPGSFSVSMKVAVGLTIEAGRASFSLPVPSAGNAQLVLGIPGNHVNVRVEPGIVSRRTNSNGETTIEATLQPGRPARVWWTTREAAAPVATREVRYLSDVKTLISIGDSQVRSAALCDINVIQGEPAEFKVALPAGFELTSVSGSNLTSSEVQSGMLVLTVAEPTRRSHEFLVVLERSSQERKVDAPLLSFADAQRETGEALVEGIGAMELTTKEAGVRRLDVREASPVFRSLAQYPLQAAFRYHRRPGEKPGLSIEWNQFPDTPVLSAIAERATVTTLLNVEGKSLTELTLRIRNQSQPFLKVELPQGASLLSAEVAGEKVKPVQGPDGSRVPLLRAGFRPSGAYTVSFVILSSGPSFGKNGVYDLTLPRLDVPVSLLNWEVFLPERLDVKQFDGNAIAASLLPSGSQDLVATINDTDDSGGQVAGMETSGLNLTQLSHGQIGGIVIDSNGATVTAATVNVISADSGSSRSARTDSDGRWLISDVRSGPVRVRIDMPGFKAYEQLLDFNSGRPAIVNSQLQVGGATEAVTVVGNSSREGSNIRRADQELQKAQAARLNNLPSSNVINFQRKVAGILPVRVDVPRAGRSYRFVRPLVLEEETKVTFRYKTK